MMSIAQFTFPPQRDWRRALRRFAISVLVIVVLLLSLYLVVVVSWGYSDGERAGYLQKLSRRGWICKTYEGELAMTTVPGIAPVIWSFSVWKGDVAQDTYKLLGKKVIVHYREYRAIPTSCFGETSYFVDRVEPIAE